MSSMEAFAPAMQEAVAHKASHQITPFMTQYTFWLIVTVIVCIVVMLMAAKKAKIIPQGFFFGGIEQLVAWLRQDIGRNTIGEGSDKHMPFLLTIFFFILTANLIALIPGTSAATGTMGVTVAIALISFIYFNVQGIKAHGAGKYFKSFAPSGLFFPMNVIIWILEVISCFLRLVTLSVRLFANMYAGHLVLGAFAILTSVFIAPVIQAFTVGALVGALPAVAWMLLLILMYVMELMVACLQAYVFTLLSAVYIQLACSTEH